MTNQDEIERIKNLALEIHALSTNPADLLFALAVVTSGLICTRFPKEQWGQLVLDQLELLLRMINEFPIQEPPSSVQ